MASELRILPEDFLDKVWSCFAEIDDDSSRDAALEAIDDACDIFNEYDPERFPLIVDGEVVEDDEVD
jgi:hypothetical protein